MQAPMAGGPSTPALAAAVCEAGGFGMLAAGFKTAAAAREDVERLRAATRAPFGVNVFVPPEAPANPAAVAAYARRLGDGLGKARFDKDDYDGKLDVVLETRPAVASFTFGCPDAGTIDRLRHAGVETWVTVTTAAEAAEAAAVGAAALVVQGVEAGGHRGSFAEGEGDVGLLALLQLVRAETDLPLVAAGGIATGAAVAAVLCLGAAAAQVGTAFMRCPESGTAPPHRDAIGTRRPTALTRAFTGRMARGIVNDFMREHSAHAPKAYPEIAHLTAPLRQAGDPERAPLWAGQAHRLALELPAAEVVARLVRECDSALAALPSSVERRAEQ
ncbi:NAD(P)H-dependent flavin oxidoreductase [Nocardioides xinjiangensis]|uniref:NAD(P)H-dependent flavin oxidoreductase n=1 Tax=Nocardioides xinjiangensis TaxID=2817376 RepID=UPI0027DACD25|nr:nitronate monooxygenase [Nocardioides sp. SYSU D00778]